MILPDYQIKELVDQFGIIDPFVAEHTSEVDGQPVISFGLSSYGYEFRLGSDFMWVAKTFEQALDVKQRQATDYVMVQTREDNINQTVFILPGNDMVLGQSLEYFKIPEDCIGILHTKSTYIRAGITITPGVLEPGWQGHITIAISNSTKRPVKLFSGEGIGQVVFHRQDRCITSYARRKGKYNNSKGIQASKI